MLKIIGIGNRVMGDDGIALIVLETIENKIKNLYPWVEVIIGETDFNYCMNHINEHDTVIIVDSTNLGIEPGEVTLFSLDQIGNSIPTSQHQLSLIHMLGNEKSVKTYIIGIEIFIVYFSLSISNHLAEVFDLICKNVFSKMEIVLSMYGEANA